MCPKYERDSGAMSSSWMIVMPNPWLDGVTLWTTGVENHPEGASSASQRLLSRTTEGRSPSGSTRMAKFSRDERELARKVSAKDRVPTLASTQLALSGGP